MKNGNQFKDETKANEMVSKVMSSDYVDLVNGIGLFFSDDIEYDEDYNHITKDNEYPLIKEKVNNIIKLVNNNPPMVYKDLESELWYMV
jgi:hypothetical protein